MFRLTLRLTQKASWTHEASLKFPRYQLALRHSTPVGDDAVHMLQVRVSALPSDFTDLTSWLAAHPRVLGVNLLDRTPTSLLLQIRTQGAGHVPRLAAEAGALVLRPVVLENGSETWTLGVSGREHVQALLTRLSQAQASPEVVELMRDDANGTSLTESQRRALNLALSRGYYDFPRRTSPADLAKEMGVSKSTFLEHLHKGESKVFAAFIHHI